MREVNLRLILLLAVALTLGACNRSTIFSRYKHTSLAGWDKNDTLTFTLNPVAEDMEVKETIGIRINDSYPFKAICLIIDQSVLPSRVSMSDTISCTLFNDDGKTKGRGISSYQYNYHLTNCKLLKGDSLVIKIRHNMKREMIPGVSDVGLTLEKVSF